MLSAALVLLALGAAVSACGPPNLNPFDHFSPHGDWFRAVVKKVALVPLFMKRDGTVGADGEGKARLVGSSIAARLKRSGIRSLRYTAWTECWARSAKRHGGLFDPRTKQAAKELHQLRFGECARELAKRSDIDAVVEPDLQIVDAPMSAGQVRWHGVQRELRSFGTLSRSDGYYDETVPALSLFVRVFDLNGDLVFENAGGIEVVAEIEGRGQLEARDDILTDESRVHRALELVFEPLIGALPAAE